MLADIEAGKVGKVIVKDMSRLGRNYLQVGLYTEMLFPQKGVRFISVNDNVDSASAVSYTHLDVYKRQVPKSCMRRTRFTAPRTICLP